jgi:hypothetical protein
MAITTYKTPCMQTLIMGMEGAMREQAKYRGFCWCSSTGWAAQKTVVISFAIVRMQTHFYVTYMYGTKLQVLLEDWLAAIFHHRLKQMAKRRI